MPPCLRPYRGDFFPPRLFGGAEVFRNLPPQVGELLIRRGEGALTAGFPELPMSLYRRYSLDGDRRAFEAVYERKRKNLADLVVAELVEESDRFLPAILDGLYSIAGETAWWLPAHNAYERDGPRLPYPDPGRPVLDLGSCETGALLATTLFLLKDRLPPQAREHLGRALQDRIYAPFEGDRFWWMGLDEGPLNNWTPWCLQNVLLSFFLVEGHGKGRLAAVTDRAIHGLNRFLEGYGEDGCCDEGPQYYRHSALTFFAAVSVLDDVTRGAFRYVFEENLVRNMASYIEKVHVHGPYYFNFADSSSVAGTCGTREFLFAQATGDADLTAFSADQWRRDSLEGRYLVEESSLLNRLIAHAAAPQLETWKVVRPEAPRSAGQNALPRIEKNIQDETYAHRPGRVSFPSVGLTIFRNSRYALAVKSGGNADSHNHNDTGSLILYRDGLPVLIDVGVETYTAQTFSDRRYELWTMQSAFHNVSNFGPHQQLPGEQYRAVVLGEDDKSIALELKDAYPRGIGLDTYLRRVDFSDAGVLIEERVRSRNQAVLTLMVRDEPAEIPGGLHLGGGGAELLFPGSCVVEALAIADERLRQALPSTIWRILIPYQETLAVRIR